MNTITLEQILVAGFTVTTALFTTVYGFIALYLLNS